MAAINPPPGLPLPPPLPLPFQNPNINININGNGNGNANPNAPAGAAPFTAPPLNPPYPPGTIINGINMTGLAPSSNPHPIPANFQAANSVQPTFTRGYIHPNALSNSALLLDVIARESARAIQANIGEHYFLSPSANPAEDINPDGLTDLKTIWGKGYKMGATRRVSRYSAMEEIIALWPELPWPQEVLNRIFFNNGGGKEGGGGVEEMGRLLMEYLPGESDWEREMKRKKEGEKAKKEMGGYERGNSSSSVTAGATAAGNIAGAGGSGVRIGKCGVWSGGVNGESSALGDKDRNRSVQIYDMDFTKSECPSVGALGHRFDPSDGKQLINAMSVDDRRFDERIREGRKPEYDVFAAKSEHERKTVYGGGNTPMGLDYSEGADMPNLILRRQQAELSASINEKAERARLAAIEQIKLKDAMRDAKEAREKNMMEGKLRNPSDPHDEPAEDRAIRLSLHKAQKVRERHLSSPLYPENSQEREIHQFEASSADHLSRNWQAQHIQAQLRHAQLRSHQQQHHHQQQQGGNGGVVGGGNGGVMLGQQGNEWVQLPAVPISEHTTPHLAMFRDYRRDMERRGGV